MTEHTTSYYAASANKYEPFPTLDESISCDVCVVGGGYTGLSSACIWPKWATTWCCWKARASASAPADATAASWLTPIAAISTSLKNLRPGCGKMLGSMMFEGGDIIRERIQRYQIQCDYRPAACLWR
jgi:gamma-glutamylputrescine oxidase